VISQFSQGGVDQGPERSLWLVADAQWIAASAEQLPEIHQPLIRSRIGPIGAAVESGP